MVTHEVPLLNTPMKGRPAMPTTRSVTLAVAPNGNWLITSDAPTFPPVALPARDFPTVESAQDYARALLNLDGAIYPEADPLTWHKIGHTLTAAGGERGAYGAMWLV